jgi:4-amino-4-deoxy-L-arabinose transferase-like glycosyltransferase
MGVITSVRLSKAKLERYPQLYYLLGTMTVLQLVWLFATGLTGASTNWPKIVGVAIYTVLIAAVVALIPETTIRKLVAVKDRLAQDERRWLIAIGAVVLLGVGFYALVQRIWPDEEYALWASRIVAEQDPGQLFNMYNEIEYLGAQHPPLMPILHGFALRLLGVSLIANRLLSVLFCLGAVLALYFLGRELFGRETGVLSAMVLLTFPLVGRLGAAGQMDVHLLFFFTLGLLAALRLQQAPSLLLALFAGLVIGLGLLTKYLMVLIFPVLGMLFIFRPGLKRVPFHLALAGVVAGIALGAWLLYARSLGILGAQQQAVSVSPSYFVSEDGGIRWLLNSLLTKLPSGIGVYNIPLILVGGWAALRRHDRRDLFLLSWAALIALALILTVPDHRYFMLTFPALALIVANWLRSKPEMMGRVVLLQLLFVVGVLFFMVDWQREAELFVR